MKRQIRSNRANAQLSAARNFVQFLIAKHLQQAHRRHLHLEGAAANQAVQGDHLGARVRVQPVRLQGLEKRECGGILLQSASAVMTGEK